MNALRLIVSMDSKAGRWFNFAILILIFLSITCFSIETIPDLSADVRNGLHIAEAVTVAVFTVEYLMRLVAADRKLSFVFSFYGIIDLVSILPFYISVGLDLRSVRALRVVRIFRLLKVFRYTKALDRIERAFQEVMPELTIYATVTAIVIYLSSVGIYYFESDVQPDKFGSVFHCLWWSIVTLTTVGYGDAFPLTVGGRVFTAFVLMAGTGTVAIPSGLFASALTKSRTSGEEIVPATQLAEDSRR